MSQTAKKSSFLESYCISIFRDNGISIQILMYQFYMELFTFILIFIAMVFGLRERSIHMYRGFGISLTFVAFVIQPLFYLNGDANFRNRVLQKGLWKALKIELFQTTQIG